MSSIIRQIVGNLHVGTSDMDVLRHVRSRCKTWHKLLRSYRRSILRDALRSHKRNQDDYRWVMGPH